jgi:hypothetical protein
LEERVRALEAEVRELKDLLDEKDEKIDMLSRIRSFHSPTSNTSKQTEDSESGTVLSRETTGTLKIGQSPALVGNESRASYFVGPSATRSLISEYIISSSNDSFLTPAAALKRKANESKKRAIYFDTDAFLENPNATNQCSRRASLTMPARLISDQLINIYFQELSPLFPILHRPTFLQLYESFTTAREPLEDKTSLAQLYLVFGIAALASSSSPSEVESFEAQWQEALSSILLDDNLPTLQCLVLAQLFCLLKGDNSRLLKYRSIAIGLSQRLGLQQLQKRYSFGPLVAETRKRTFWTQYTLDV